ncbi:hypothetical protein [Mycobacteroides abscessus]|uniref:hypothetical protein n=1 Tax=Mycobacteroides abscessus TaxID=36809 RepID=UPI0013000D5D|nr:hypothetical protein [Mycobacteroides abscessus]
MAITSTQCFEAHCDVCGIGYGGYDEDEDRTVHYQDRAAMESSLEHSQWSLTGTRLLCPKCVETAACDLVGHPWDQWEPFHLPERPGHPGYDGQQRWCDRCGAVEYNPPVPKEVTSG